MKSEDVEIVFDKFWAEEAPVFPDPEVHTRHKLIARLAFFSGYVTAFKEFVDKK